LIFNHFFKKCKRINIEYIEYTFLLWQIYIESLEKLIHLDIIIKIFYIIYRINMFDAISEKQKRVYDFYKKYIDENWYSPSYTEASTALDLVPSVVFSHVRILERKWYLRRTWKWGVMLTESKGKKIPILWRIACWRPIEVSEYIEDEIEVPDSMIRNWDGWYALIANWDSMQWAWIFDWDLLIIRHQNIVNDWDIAVVIIKDWFDEKATLKQVFRTPDAMVLMPKNPAFTPIYTRNCEIRWKLVWVIRQF